MLKTLAVLSALLLAPAVLAQDAPPPPPPPAGGMPQPEQIFAFLDADKDGYREERSARTNGPVFRKY